MAQKVLEKRLLTSEIKASAMRVKRVAEQIARRDVHGLKSPALGRWNSDRTLGRIGWFDRRHFKAGTRVRRREQGLRP